MNVPVIDIHPHVIAADSQRYPRAPLGGHQSAWSQERPVGVEQLIVEQDRAGIRKAALVQASTCYGHDNSYVADAVAAYPDRFTGVFSCDILAPDALRHDGALDGPGADRLAALHHRQHHARASRLAGRSAIVSRLAQGRGERASRLSPDDGRRYPADRERAAPLSRACAWCSITLPARSRRMGRPTKRLTVCGGSPRFPGVYLKVTERNFVGAKKGQATPETFFGRLVSEFGASRIAWGSNFPASERSLPELVALAQDTLRFLPETDREWIFSRTAQTLYPALADQPVTRDRGFTRHAALAARQPRRHRGAEEPARVRHRWSRSTTPTSRWSTPSSRR